MPKPPGNGVIRPACGTSRVSRETGQCRRRLVVQPRRSIGKHTTLTLEQLSILTIRNLTKGVQLYYHGFPTEELERQLAGAYALAETYGHIEFYARQARRQRDPRKYWIDFFSSRINWWPRGYKPPPDEAYTDDAGVSLCDRPPGLSADIAEALRRSALAVYPAIQEMIAKYRDRFEGISPTCTENPFKPN